MRPALQKFSNFSDPCEHMSMQQRSRFERQDRGASFRFNGRLRGALILIVSALAVPLFNNCGVSTPSLSSASFATANFQHSGLETSCLTCHSSNRPTGINTPVTWSATNVNAPFDYASHGGTMDCASCHQSKAGFMTWANWGGANYVHLSVLTACTSCHTPQRPDLQVPAIAASALGGFDHATSATSQDCFSCHSASMSRGTFASIALGGDWSGGQAAGARNYDPAFDDVMSTNPITFSGTSVATVGTLAYTSHMAMNHSTTQIPAGVISGNCNVCHADLASTGAARPGYFHSSLTALATAAGVTINQPTACSDCHNSTNSDWPIYFIGNPPATGQTYSRFPSSPEFKHTATAWVANGAAPGGYTAGTTPLVTVDCVVCHVTPNPAAPLAPVGSYWGVKIGEASPAGGEHNANYHTSLFNKSISQPSSCLACHANSRPSLGNAGISGDKPVGTLNYLHTSSVSNGTTSGMGDCIVCHTGGASGSPVWTTGKFHLAGGTTPSTCMPCHTTDRPTTTSAPFTWATSGYTSKPFDYGSGSANVATGNTHGAGQDCVLCHNGPGSGVWGSTQNWQNGSFNHATGLDSTSGKTLISESCSSCHSSQRPDLNGHPASQFVSPYASFDHSTAGTGDCLGCHSATVTAGLYTTYLSSGTGYSIGATSQSNWYGGVGYPGSNPIASGANKISVTEYVLQGSPLYTGSTSSTANLLDDMIHTASNIPATIVPTAPTTNCTACHTSSSAVVGGIFHPAVTVAGGSVTTKCSVCHSINTMPAGVVEGATGYLAPMDHTASFGTAVTINNGSGMTSTTVSGLDCANCHSHPGIYAVNPGTAPVRGAWPTADATNGSWKDGKFHTSIGTTNVPTNCAQCHYLTMTNSAVVDKLFTDLEFPAAVNGQTLQIQMKHLSTLVTTQNCATCHVTYATTSALTQSGTVASTSWAGAMFHTTLANANQPSTSCLDCHTGTVPTSSTTATVAASNVYLPNGTLATGQTLNNGVAHTVFGGTTATGVDCAVCHTPKQAAASNLWVGTGAKYHTSTAYTSLSSPPNCLPCHAATKPTSVVTTSDATGSFDHSGIGTSDCNSCHTYAGKNVATGTNSMTGPNWLGATAAPTIIAFPGQTSSLSTLVNYVYYAAGAGFAANATTAMGVIGTAGGAGTLPHPTVGTQACTVCHPATPAVPAYTYLKADHYDHGGANATAVSLIANKCSTCHEAGAGNTTYPTAGNLMSNVAFNNSTFAGDTRPIGMTTMTVQGYQAGTCTISGSSSGVGNHFYPTDCSACHNSPGTAVVGASTGAVTGSSSKWAFTSSKHKPSGVSCNLCHVSGCKEN